MLDLMKTNLNLYGISFSLLRNKLYLGTTLTVTFQVNLTTNGMLKKRAK